MKSQTTPSLLKSIISPRRFNDRPKKSFEKVRVFAIIPSFKPRAITTQLIEDLVRWNPSLTIILVDDCTPSSYLPGAEIFKKCTSISERVTLIRTPENTLKAGAINYALSYLQKNNIRPDVVLTLDDDVVIERNTVSEMISSLLADERLGAVCSQSRVFNKNKNLITRLQGLEYLGFNATRLADEGFFHGPLVMHGMLTAFRISALEKVRGFTEHHLIEDYEITARLKEAGFDVRLASAAYAWTEVPESLIDLWKQRTRWISGGVSVVKDSKYWPAVVQDIIGHTLFISTILVLFAFFLLTFDFGAGPIPPLLAYAILFFSVVQTLIWFLFQLWFMRFYDERDAWDWIIRISFIPEFIYANSLTVVLLGAYLFHITDSLLGFLARHIRIFTIRGWTLSLFSRVGYSKQWNTRDSH